MYYPVRIVYAGPNRADRDPNAYGNRDHYSIESTIQRTNLSGQEIAEGWLGQTGDWSYTALGEFAAIEQAREAIRDDADDEVMEWTEGSGIRVDDASIEVWVERDREIGDLLVVEWGDDEYECETPDGVVWLYSEDNSGRCMEQAWQNAADAIDANAIEDHDEIIEYLQGLGWQTEMLTHAAWGARLIVGRPPTT
jgi:hypothetical protein